MNEVSIIINGKEKDLRGACHLCPHYDEFANCCDYYKIVLNGQGFEPTCNNIERIIKEEAEKQIK